MNISISSVSSLIYRAWREVSTGGGEEDDWRMLLSNHSHSPVELQSERRRDREGGEHREDTESERCYIRRKT